MLSGLGRMCCLSGASWPFDDRLHSKTWLVTTNFTFSHADVCEAAKMFVGPVVLLCQDKLFLAVIQELQQAYGLHKVWSVASTGVE